jgi:hypothetical protein
MQRAFAGVILGLTLFGSALGYLCVHSAHYITPYSIPFACVILLCSCVGGIALISNSRSACLLQNGLVLASFILLVFTIRHWPGGDDGRGMLLVGGVGPTLFSALIIAGVSTFYRPIAKIRKGNQQNPPIP